MQPGEPNNTNPPEETEELFPVAILDKHKAGLTIIMIMYSSGLDDDEEKDEEFKLALQECAEDIINCFNELQDEEEIGFPYIGLTVFYQALYLGLNVAKSPGGGDLIRQLLEAKKFNASPHNVKSAQESCVRVAIHYINYINKRFEQNPAVIELKATVEENWRDIKQKLKGE